MPGDIMSIMKTTSFLQLCVLVLSCVLAQAVGADDTTAVRIVLAGDSTVTDHAGWGEGFCELLNDSAECINLAKGGRSSRSYRSEGWWQKCLELKPDFLLIQFGHNDQPGKGPLRESAADGDFRDHLRKYVDEASAVGCMPVLISSLTRRRWDDQHQIQPTLAEYAAATAVVAEQMDVPFLDLHHLSIEHCNAIGPEAFRAFEPMTQQGADHTHLNPEGSQAVGRIVAQELIRIVPKVARYLKVEQLNVSDHRGNSQLHNAVSGLRLTETDAAITISRGEAAVVVYNKQSPPVPEGINPVYNRSGFLHPVSTPAGRVVTAAFPYDHPHQDGVFSAWVKTSWNGQDVDFWNLAGGTGRVVHQRVVATFSDDTSTGFEVDLVHRTQQPPFVDVLRERWKVTVRPTDGSYFDFDLESTQTAITNIPLIVKEYHYGGMALRGPTRWLTGKVKEGEPAVQEAREPNSFLNDHGSDRIRGNHEKARWVSLSGLMDGKPVSITVLCHTDNFRAPQAARLHPTKPYFCFAPCVEGEFVIDREHPVHTRYRYLVTDSLPDTEWLNMQWESWCDR